MKYFNLFVCVLFYSLFIYGQALAIGPYTDNNDGTVTDAGTGLMWQKATADTDGDGDIDESDKLTWTKALSYCENLTLGGHSDWRLPDIKELESIMIDDNRNYPVINPVFSWELSYYWSATTYADGTDHAWDVDFGYHNDSWGVKSDSDYVRCVRGGLSGSSGNLNLGDVSGDGQINIVDALFVARYAVKLPVSNFNVKAADVNCDNQITIVDALLIARKAVKLPVSGWCASGI